METNKNLAIVEKLNDGIAMGIEANSLNGFKKAFLLANASKLLKDLLTPEYMKPIKELCGSSLGFKTDKDNETNGYSESIIKNCVIEAVLTGVQVVGNQFNIIAGNCYITKNGFGFMLNNMNGLSWEIIPKLPRINSDNTSAAIIMVISWSMDKKEKQTREIDFAIRMNKYMGIDAVIGKATRKARAWLYNAVTGIEVSDGDAQDFQNDKKTIDITPAPAKVAEYVPPAKNIQEKKEPEPEPGQQSHEDGSAADFNDVLKELRNCLTLKELKEKKLFYKAFAEYEDFKIVCADKEKEFKK